MGVIKIKNRALKRMLWGGALLLSLASLFLIYLWVGLRLMRQNAQRSGVIDPATPFFEKIAGQNPDCGELKVTVLGDSTAIGTGTSSRQQTYSYQAIRKLLLPRYAAVNYSNRAVSGALLKDLLDTQLKPALEDKPDLIFISIGANDTTGFTSPQNFKNGLKTLLDTLNQETQAQIFLLGIPDIHVAPLLLPLFPPIIDFLTHRLIEVEEKFLQDYSSPRLHPVELYRSTGPIFGAHPDFFAADHYHPNDTGYGVWSKELEKSLSAALDKKQLPCFNR